MSPRRTRRGTVRESISEISINTSSTANKSAKKSTRSTNKKHVSKGSEEDSDGPAELKISAANTLLLSSTLNDTSKSTRSRNRRGQDVTDDVSLSVTVHETAKTPAKTRNQKSAAKTSKTKKVSKTSKVEELRKNSLISEDESVDEKKQRLNISDDLITEDEESPPKRIKSNNGETVLPKGKVKAAKSPKRKVTLSKVESSEIVTPKTSPLNVSFTPHRSNKTPKKSPSNLGSPKTHARNARKLLNVPRKLSILDSPTSSEKSLQQSNVKNESTVSAKRKSNLKSPTLTVKPRLSKSPKLVLTSVKSKKKSSAKQNESSAGSISLQDTTISAVSPTKPTKSPSKSKKSTKQDSSETKSSESASSAKLGKSLEINLSQDTLKTNDSQNKSKTKKSPKINSSRSKKSSLWSSKAKKCLNATLPMISRKMPKIVLQLKSKESYQRLTKSLTPSKSRKSPLKEDSSSKKGKKSHKDLSLSNKSLKNDSPSKLKKSKSISPSKVEKVLIKSPNKKSVISPLMSPMVVVNKLITPQLQKSPGKVKGSEPRISLVPVDHPAKSPAPTKAKKSPPKSAKNRIVLNSRASAIKKDLTPSDVLDRKLKSLKPANTSTPRERIKRTLNAVSSKKRSPSKEASNNSHAKSKVIKRLNDEPKNDSSLPMLEDESEPSLNDSSLIRMSDVFDVDASRKDNTFEKHSLLNKKSRNSPRRGRKSDTFEIDQSASDNNKSKKNDTYEVDHPKTPGMQKNPLKRTVDEAELSGNGEAKESKKVCKVHFAPGLNKSGRSSSINRVGTPGHAIQQKRSASQANKSASTANNTPTVVRRRSASLAESAIKSRRSNHEAQITSVNRLSKPRVVTDSAKKIESKTPSNRKIPNFAEIHQKNFAKMESLVDLKKRVEKRHVVLKNAVTPNTQKLANPATRQSGGKPIATDSTNGNYNRYGFKLRKNDAVNIVSKKQASKVDSREKKREDARTALKGVRTNRRFELIMKARSKAS